MSKQSSFNKKGLCIVFIGFVNHATATDDLAFDSLNRGSGIQQSAYIKASNTGNDQFGFSVAASGNTLVVGAPRESSDATGVNGDENNNSANGSGAVYVFTLSPGGVWSQQAYIKASNTGIGDEFGSSVDISGDTLVVGAAQERSNATGVNGDQSDNSLIAAGAAYVFTRTAGVWSQQAYLKASNTEASDRFGTSVAISGDTIAVGAYTESSDADGIDGNDADNSASQAGAAYVFVRNGSTWSQQAYVKASNSDLGDRFGFSLDLSGDTLVVGAEQEDSNAVGVGGDQDNNLSLSSGAAYVFVRTGTIWSQQAYLKASNNDSGDIFGVAVAIDGDIIVVGATAEDSNAQGINGDGDDDSFNRAGAAYIFNRSPTFWSEDAYVKASNTGASDNFGYSVAVSGNTVLIGAYAEDSNATGIDGDETDNSESLSGAVYRFTRDAGMWSQEAYIKASNTDSFDRFGESVTISGQFSAIGANTESSSATGINGNESSNSFTAAGAVYAFNGVDLIFVDGFE